MRTLASLAILAASFAPPILADDVGATEPAPAAQSFKLGTLTLTSLKLHSMQVDGQVLVVDLDAAIKVE